MKGLIIPFDSQGIIEPVPIPEIVENQEKRRVDDVQGLPGFGVFLLPFEQGRERRVARVTLIIWFVPRLMADAVPFVEVLEDEPFEVSFRELVHVDPA